MIGDVLGSYRVVSRLGAGGMGTVWLSEHQLLGSHAAIKVLLPEMSLHPKMVQRFFDEARAASRIQDPGIVRVLDFGWHDGRAYLVMEHLSGETLAARIERVHLLAPLDAIRILQQCAIAMAAAHACGIVHRDLKPDNIFLVPDAAVPGGERIKILDFGIAKLVDGSDLGTSRTQTGVIMGTPAFMSPEQCRGAGGVDHRADIYALGCVLFTMLCGRPPFDAPTAGDMIASHLMQAPPVPSSLVPSLTPQVDALILRCLEKPAEQRFQSMTELVRAGAQLTGENLSIPTIAPMRAIERVAAEPRPASNTTLGNSSGEAAPSPRRWRGGLVIAITAISVIGVIAIAVTRAGQGAASAPGPGDAAPVVTRVLDASEPTPDVTTATEGSRVPPASRVLPGPPTGSGSGSGSGHKPTGSGSGSGSDSDSGSGSGSGSGHKPTGSGSGSGHKPTGSGSGSGHKPTGSGTGHKPTGSGSGSGSGSGKPYDPFADR